MKQFFKTLLFGVIAIPIVAVSVITFALITVALRFVMWLESKLTGKATTAAALIEVAQNVSGMFR